MAIRWDKFTIKAQEAIQAANDVASEHGNPEMLPLHILSALLSDKEGVVVPVLGKIGLNVEALKQSVEREIAALPKQSGGGAHQASLSRAASGVLERAFKEADEFKDEYVSTEHLLLALADQKGDAAQRALASQGATRDAILQALTSVRGNQRVTDQNPEAKYQALERYARDLTDLARRGKLDPVIGRDEEIRRVIQVLSRRTKNNPVLIGEPGVGKTAGCLTYARFAYQHWIVFCAPRKHLDHAADLFVASDHRIELAATCEIRQVASVALQRLVFRFGILVCHSLISTH